MFSYLAHAAHCERVNEVSSIASSPSFLAREPGEHIFAFGLSEPSITVFFCDLKIWTV